ncbi:MAG: hypothetical protein V7609_2076 [Verrucomicrobiota bacterium]
MRYVDLDSGELRRLMTASPVVCETDKRGGTRKYPIQFVRDAVVIELAGTVAVTLGFKAPAGYDSVAYILGPFTAAKTSTGTATVYTFTISFLNALLDQLLAGNLDDVTLRPEIKWASTNENGETLAFDWNVQNNVIRGGESVIAYPITDSVLDLPLVTRLTGGVALTDLDAQLLAGFPNGKKFSIVVDPGDGVTREFRFQKRAGSELVTDLTVGFILCLDGTRIYRIDS